MLSYFTVNKIGVKHIVHGANSLCIRCAAAIFFSVHAKEYSPFCKLFKLYNSVKIFSINLRESHIFRRKKQIRIFTCRYFYIALTLLDFYRCYNKIKIQRNTVSRGRKYGNDRFKNNRYSIQRTKPVKRCCPSR